MCQGKNDRVEHAAACRVAWKRGRDQRIRQEDAITQSERRPPEYAHHEEADAPSESRFHNRIRDEKRDDHQQNALIGEAREGFLRIDRTTEYRRRYRQQRGRQQWKRVQNDRENGRCEYGEEMPGLFREPRGNGPEPDPECQEKGKRSLHLITDAVRGCTHGFGSPTVSELSRAPALQVYGPPTQRAVVRFNHVLPLKGYSPVMLAKRPVPPRIVPVMRLPVPTISPFNSL